MIIRSMCNSCMQPYKLSLHASEVHLIKQIASEDGKLCPCPRLCGGQISLVKSEVFDTSGKPRLYRDAVEISGTELYKAVNGLGLPDELPKEVVVVEALIKANRVDEVVAEEIQGRVFLHALKLSGGVTLHLCSGSHGAQVLKITKERADGAAHRD